MQAPAKLFENILPRNSVAPVALDTIEAPVKFLPLIGGQRHSILVLTQAVPEALDQPQALGRTQFLNVHGSSSVTPICGFPAD